ncbi:FAD binding domain-containing protein [Granulosicoccus antarcticus]|uniref:Carbon monoxide dehydrogenase medium chain n=1 Tax=Granulosicoccus antarcticus IMCC3135 TaxID=1192854 RepID=A0A2Z2NJ50_9GAMM|nr:xanthine dehydrogenase family protein subunit M [Granulosicoccus antarcticus]ASJ70525.1 Carbon monoxide dehydrogenase medium chain [Granulosicoccus antarcticus IMCC3135]
MVRYEAPQTTPEAIALLASAKGRVHILAGGTDLIVRMKGEYIEPDVIVDIKRIKSMQSIRKTAAGTSIGAAATCGSMGRHKALKKAWPGVVEAANLIGSDQIQGRCTIVGNLCNASPAADSIPALIAAGAQALVIGPKGERLLDVDKIPTGPGKNSLKKGEMVVSIELPARAPRSADAYLRFTPRTEMDIAVVSAAVNLTIDKKSVITEARVVLGAVAITAIRVPAAEAALIGNTLDEATLAAVAEACSAACNPINDKRGTVEYRTRVAGVLAKRAAQSAWARAGGKA